MNEQQIQQANEYIRIAKENIRIESNNYNLKIFHLAMTGKKIQAAITNNNLKFKENNALAQENNVLKIQKNNEIIEENNALIQREDEVFQDLARQIDSFENNIRGYQDTIAEYTRELERQRQRQQPDNSPINIMLAMGGQNRGHRNNNMPAFNDLIGIRLNFNDINNVEEEPDNMPANRNVRMRLE